MENDHPQSENTIAKKTGLPCLADDSGLTVDALDGAPGVYSARYAGVHGDDEANNEKLIRELQGKSDRTAHYVCALALVHPDGASVTAEASCDGEFKTRRLVPMDLAMIHISLFPDLVKPWRSSISIRRKPSVIVVRHCNNW